MPHGSPVKVTQEVPVKLAPESVTCDPAGPLVGEKELIVGGAVESTSKKLGSPSPGGYM